MPTAEDFTRHVAHYAGQTLTLDYSEVGRTLFAGDERLGELRPDPGTSPDWEARAREGSWQLSWEGRVRKRIYGAADGHPAIWFHDRRVGRGGALLLPDGREFTFRPRPTTLSWNLSAETGVLARVTGRLRSDETSIHVELTREAGFVAELALLVLTAASVAILDASVWSPRGASGGGGM